MSDLSPAVPVRAYYEIDAGVLAYHLEYTLNGETWRFSDKLLENCETAQRVKAMIDSGEQVYMRYEQCLGVVP